jgi:hypothetical protein
MDEPPPGNPLRYAAARFPWEDLLTYTCRHFLLPVLTSDSWQPSRPLLPFGLKADTYLLCLSLTVEAWPGLRLGRSEENPVATRQSSIIKPATTR